MNKPMHSKLIEYDIRPTDTSVFLHIPKSGGVTLGTLIDPMWAPGARCAEYLTLPLARMPREQIAQYRSFLGHFNYSALVQLLPPGFQTITMLREPLARHISLLRMFKRLGAYAADNTMLPAMLQIGNPFIMQIFLKAKSEGGEEILRGWREDPLEVLIEDEQLQIMQGLVNGQSRQITPLRLIGKNIAGRPGLIEEEVEQALLESAWENLQSMPCFGLTERFQDSLYMLSYLFGWRPISNSLRLNAAPEKFSVDSLPASTRDKLTGYNNLDIKLYEMARALFEERFANMTEELLARYGDSTHARLPRPLSDEILVSLLDKHYQARLLARTGPRTESSSRFTFDQTVSGGFGWQRREVSPAHGPFRWTGPGNESSIDLAPLTGGDIQLRVGVCDSMSQNFLEELKITVNEEALPCQRTSSDDGLTIFEVEARGALISTRPFLRVGLITPKTRSPQSIDSGNPDSRQLGVAINWIEQIKP